MLPPLPHLLPPPPYHEPPGAGCDLNAVRWQRPATNLSDMCASLHLSSTYRHVLRPCYFILWGTLIAICTIIPHETVV